MEQSNHEIKRAKRTARINERQCQEILNERMNNLD